MKITMQMRAGLAFTISLFLIPAFFAFDLYLPMDVAAGVPYVALVLVGLITRQPVVIIIQAIIGTILTIVGYILSPEVGNLEVVLINRALALFAIWSVAIVCYFHLVILARLEPLATRDQLTKLFNRHYFTFEVVKQINFWRRHQQALSMLLLDIDHFKEINDTYGHLAGDYALQSIAEICVRQVRDVDTVARIGGEEFAILLPSTGVNGALQMAERIRTDVESFEFNYGKDSFKLTVSIGITELSDETWSVTEFLKAADEMLYKAKMAGRNQCVATNVNNQ